MDRLKFVWQWCTTASTLIDIVFGCGAIGTHLNFDVHFLHPSFFYFLLPSLSRSHSLQFGWRAAKFIGSSVWMMIIILTVIRRPCIRAYAMNKEAMNFWIKFHNWPNSLRPACVIIAVEIKTACSDSFEIHCYSNKLVGIAYVSVTFSQFGNRGTSSTRYEWMEKNEMKTSSLINNKPQTIENEWQSEK